jgi:hypothetical protein
VKTRTLDALDFRDEVPCEHCFVSRLKRAFDERYIACKPEFELLIVTPEQKDLMRRIVRFSAPKATWVSESSPPRTDLPVETGTTTWWGVPILVQKR